MLPPCFRLAERVFPLVRQHAAVHLAAAGYTQKEIGERLGVSQAMVSKYLKAKAMRPEEEDEWIVAQMALELTHDDTTNGAKTTDDGTNPWCRTLAMTTGEHQEDRREIVSDLVTLLSRLRGTDVARLVPAVGMNIAGALPQAQDRVDVAAFPGRLAHVQGTLRAHAPPEFGASNHLAHLVIKAQNDETRIRFAMNLAGTKDVLAAAKKNKETIVHAEANERDDAAVAGFKAPTPRFALADPGGFGIEPALYLLDDDAASLVRRIERLAARIR